MRSTLTWVALGLVGLVLAGGAAVGAMRLTGQDAGLAGEPLDAGNELIPRDVRTTTTTQRTTTTTVPQTPTVRTPTPTVSAPRPVPQVTTTTRGADDHGGRGRGGHGSDGDDD